MDVTMALREAAAQVGAVRELAGAATADDVIAAGDRRRHHAGH
jgi:hypothetical protein